MRLYLRALSEIGVVECPRSEFPTSVDFEITTAGRAALLGVGKASKPGFRPHRRGRRTGYHRSQKLDQSPRRGLVHPRRRPLAARPLSLTELDSLIPRISYPSLERRLAAMRECDLVKVQRGAGRLRPYEVTALAASVRHSDHLRHRLGAQTAPGQDRGLGRLDVEAAFLLAIPPLDLPEG